MRAVPPFAKYSLNPDSHEKGILRSRIKIIDGDLVRCCNIAGYINSASIPRALQSDIQLRPSGRIIPNIEWVYVDGSPAGYPKTQSEFYIGMYAIRTIWAGNELLASYPVKP